MNALGHVEPSAPAPGALAALQQDFQAYLLGRPNGMAARVRSTSKADAGTLLNVYGEAYVLRLLEALGDDFPALKAVLGDDGFDRLGRAYVAAHPSRHASVRWFGDHLAPFLAESEPARPLLAQLAAFERALRAAFDAADETPLGLNDLAAVPQEAWPSLSIVPMPSLRRLELAPAVVQASQAQEAGVTPHLDEHAAETASWAVWRPELVVEFRSLELDEAWGLDTACAGESFATLCEGLCRWHEPDAVAGRAVSLLAGWIGQGMVADARWGD